MSQEPHSRPSQDKRVQLEAIFLKSVGESLPREGWVELMCLLVGKPRAADLLKELGDTREISVSDFLGLLFDKVPASATGMDQNEKPQATSTEAVQLGTAQAYAALPAQELHQELPLPFAPELHGESPEVQAESDEAAPKLPSTEDAE
ncbi:unnamed protein product, partial [Effrenium voratum]